MSRTFWIAWLRILQAKNMAQAEPNDVNKELNDIDFVLKDVGGTFGRFQICNYLMLSASIFISGTSVLEYVFAALEIDHR